VPKNEKRARLLDLDPELGEGLDAEAFERARVEIVVPTLSLDPGLWEPSEALPDANKGQLGVLVLDGLLTRDVVIAETSCAELVGPGDVLRPWDHLGIGAPVPSRVEWHVLADSNLAVIVGEAVGCMSAYPEVVSVLVTRAVRRTQTLAVVLAISSIIGLKVRLLALFWHLADRFGTVSREGVQLPLPLTHQVISRLVGARRPSVSTAMKDLENEGRIGKRPGGGFLLFGEPPELGKLLGDRRPAHAGALVGDAGVGEAGGR
jgi:CRP/FNR family transcriptional regulator, cyclic AMP receptor protein